MIGTFCHRRSIIIPDLAIAALIRKRAKLAAQLAELERKAIPLRPTFFTSTLLSRSWVRQRATDAGAASAGVVNLGRLILDVLRGAPEPMAARETWATRMLSRLSSIGCTRRS